MKQTKKKLISLLLTMTLLLGLVAGLGLPVSAALSGDCGADGNNVTWSLDTATGTLTISGSGKMENYISAFASKAPWESYKETIQSVVIGNGVTSIGYDAFHSCDNLTSVTIPDSVTSIEHGAFEACSSLTSVTISDSVTSIGPFAFFLCSNLTSITIPDSVTSIGMNAFDGCTNLLQEENGIYYVDTWAVDADAKIEQAILRANTRGIGGCAFRGCDNLTSVTIPDSVTSIGQLAFWPCDNLASVTIPDSVTSIEQGAFNGCRNLPSLIIPDSVTNMEGNVFYECETLTIYCEAKEQPADWDATWNPDSRPVVWGYGVEGNNPEGNDPETGNSEATDPETTDPETTTPKTTDPAADEAKSGCGSSLDSTYAVIALVAVLGFALVAKKKENN